MKSGLRVILVFNLLWNFVGAVNQADLYIHESSSPIDVWYHRNTRVADPNNDNLPCLRPAVYICEEPANVVPPENSKVCNYRNVFYQEQIFRWVAGRGCLLYTPDFLYVEGTNTINLNAGCYFGELYAPCLELPKEDGTCGCYPFDPGLEVVLRAVRQAQITAAQGRWERCFYEAVDCCAHIMGLEVPEGNCHATYDGWTCWHDTPPNNIATEVCSEFAYSNSGPSCNHYSTKTCFQNSTWDLQTDYATCSVTPRLLRRYRFHIAVLSFSIVSCLPAVVVFFFYKRLRVTRVALHRNLLLAIIFRNILVIVSRSEIYIDELTNTGDTSLSNHSIACRVLAIAERIASNAVFVCMLLEGIYLHRLIVSVFRKKLNLKILYSFGAFLVLAPVIAWSAVMGTLNDHSCWLVYTVDNVQWILDGPRITILVVNAILFIDILRVLLTKLRNTENTNQLNTTKATLFLMPLFGSQFLLTAFRPNTTDCTGEEVYFYITYALESFQGFIVATLYCYFNKEVRMLIKATYLRTESAVVSRVRPDSNYRRATSGVSSDRRMTYSTGVPLHSISNNEIQSPASPAPKLHLAEIVSLQASEKLAQVLEPAYETLSHGIVNEAYETDSGCIQNRESKADDYYDYTNTSSVSIDCQDWIKCVSTPSSSVYENSLNDYEIKYLEKKFPDHRRRALSEDSGSTMKCDGSEIFQRTRAPRRQSEFASSAARTGNREANRLSRAMSVDAPKVTVIEELEPDFEGFDRMFNEIMNLVEYKELDVVLDPELLSPNRGKDDKIIFLDS